MGRGKEQQFRAELKDVTANFLGHSRCAEVFTILGIPEQQRSSIVVMDWFPDGGCDFVRILLPDDKIAELDLPWTENDPVEVVGLVPIEIFSKRLSKSNQIKLAVARGLATITQWQDD